MNQKNAFQRWLWTQLLKTLDDAGYAIVKKPTITKGKPR